LWHLCLEIFDIHLWASCDYKVASNHVVQEKAGQIRGAVSYDFMGI
jgi:hypothetical protein